MNNDIMIGDFTDKESDQKDSEAKQSEQDENEGDDSEKPEIRPEYSRQRIQEICPKMSAIMHSGTSGQKHFDKIEANLFEKLFNSFKKVFLEGFIL